MIPLFLPVKTWVTVVGPVPAPGRAAPLLRGCSSAEFAYLDCVAVLLARCELSVGHGPDMDHLHLAGAAVLLCVQLQVPSATTVSPSAMIWFVLSV